MGRTKYTKKTKKPYKKSYKMMKFKPSTRNLNTHHFKGHYIKPNYLDVLMNGTDIFFTTAFTLNDLPNNAEFTALFDEYRINAVLYELKPRYNSNLILTADPAAIPATTNMLSANNLGLPEINTVIDLNDATAPTTTAQLVEYQTFKQTRGNTIHKRKVIPRMLLGAETSGGPTSASTSMAKKWITTNRPDVIHYGIKGSISNIPNINLSGNFPSFFVDLHITYYISCKNTK